MSVRTYFEQELANAFAMRPLMSRSGRSGLGRQRSSARIRRIIRDIRDERAGLPMSPAKRNLLALAHLRPVLKDALEHPLVLTDQRENWRALHLQAAVDALEGKPVSAPITRERKSS